MTICLRALATLVLFSAALTGDAHPLHLYADFSAGIAHPFFGLDHVLAAIAVGIWATRLAGRALWVVPLAFVSGTLAGSAVGLASIPLAASETLVALSVLALGVLIFVNRSLPLALSALIAAAVAVGHGFAHTAGVSVTGSAPLFIAGLAAGTALLHAAGIAAALTVPKAARAAGLAIALAGCYLVAGAVL